MGPWVMGGIFPPPTYAQGAWLQDREWLLPSIPRSFLLEKMWKEVPFPMATSFLPSFLPLPAAEEREDDRVGTRFVPRGTCSLTGTALAWCWPAASLHLAGHKQLSPVPQDCNICVALQARPTMVTIPLALIPFSCQLLWAPGTAQPLHLWVFLALGGAGGQVTPEQEHVFLQGVVRRSDRRRRAWDGV